jgi:hypothetical protein
MDYRQAAAHLHEAQKRILDRAPSQDGRIVRWKRSVRRRFVGAEGRWP